MHTLYMHTYTVYTRIHTCMRMHTYTYTHAHKGNCGVNFKVFNCADLTVGSEMKPSKISVRDAKRLGCCSGGIMLGKK